jgi:hypothetical protein
LRAGYLPTASLQRFADHGAYDMVAHGLEQLDFSGPQGRKGS